MTLQNCSQLICVCYYICRYCVILVFEASLASRDEVQAFREFVSAKQKLGNVNFLYAFIEVQKFTVDVWKRPDGEFKVGIRFPLSGIKPRIYV